MKKIFKQQALIKNIVTDVLEEVKKMNMRPASKDEEEIMSIFQLFENFPINSDDEMIEFENLLEEKEKFDCAVSIMYIASYLLNRILNILGQRIFQDRGQ